MGRWLKRIALSLLITALSFSLISSPVFATATDPATTNPDTSTTTPADTTDDENTEENTDEAANDTTATEQTTDNPTCYDQVGGVGWLVCPGTGLLANIIDGAYGVLDNLLLVDPIPNDPTSPIHVVWDYIRNITNLIFVLFFLAIIFSQLTGVGINNYGIKRMLPRLVIAAILINLSYTIY